ncbi:SDR family NAD(P)-dependent oxidoreductase [Paenibacillus sp. 1P07SE]|uniref:SDR family NAD(P)-dependent oxidoreductase n=1 Tax=Paenibacillus sp. 1P07SE TaxID=3132209 RepID=UPI0039A6215E
MTPWALVTGADRGLGLALVKRLLAGGCHVLAGQFADEEGELGRLESQSGARLIRLRLDISDAGSVATAVERVRAVTDRLDILVNNGAVLGNITATIEDELDFAEMEQVFRVNTLGALRVTQALIGLLLQSDSKLLVNISSEAGSIGDCKRTSWYAYCMSKAALNMQSQLIYNQIRPQGGKVLVIHPGHVQSYMQGKLDTTGKLTPDQSAARIQLLMEQRLAAPADGEPLALLDCEGRVLPW